jgi:hypothetical protein
MSRFNFAGVDPSAYAECSLRLGQILFTLIQPSPSVEGKLKSILILISLLFQRLLVPVVTNNG